MTLRTARKFAIGLIFAGILVTVGSVAGLVYALTPTAQPVDMALRCAHFEATGD
jgi:hypothetical protein